MPRVLPILLILLGLPLQPAGAQTRPQSPEQNDLDGHETLFTVLAALNAAGFDLEASSPTNHPLRAAVKRQILAANPPSLSRLKKFITEHQAATPNDELARYISFALASGPPPTFKPKFDINRMPPEAAALYGLDELLTEFYREAGIAQLWKQAQPAFDEAIARYQAPVAEAVFQANAYLRNPTSGMSGRRFHVVIDLLGPPNQVQSRSFLDDYYVVITPSVQMRTSEVQHAYLHYLLDPLTIRNAGKLENKRALIDLTGGAPLLPDAYKDDFNLLTSMCLLKAVEARMDKRLGQAHVDQAMKEGFILTAYFYEALPLYEKQEQALRLYLPVMFEAIDVAKEDKRIARVEFATKRAVRTVSAPKAAAPPQSALEKDQEQADELYRQKNFTGARAIWQRLAQDNSSRPAQAKAYFGLARIATLEKDPELAQQLFEKTLELNPDAFERAWSHVYLARLALATQEPDLELVRKQYQAALAVAGASEAARKAAETELQSVANRKNP